MAKNKNNQAIWGTRIKDNTSNLFQKLGSSINIDKRLYKEDIAVSIAHVEMLSKNKIISSKDKTKIIKALNQVKRQIDKINFNFKVELEDVHMNIEDAITKKIGNSNERIAKNAKNLHFWAFWAKMANFGQFLAKMGKTEIFSKKRFEHFFHC